MDTFHEGLVVLLKLILEKNQHSFSATEIHLLSSAIRELEQMKIPPPINATGIRRVGKVVRLILRFFDVEI